LNQHAVNGLEVAVVNLHEKSFLEAIWTSGSLVHFPVVGRAMQ
jgi:hypothetical protein